jgi:hypothetical protein
MEDLFLKIANKAALDAIINPLLPEGETFGNYFQNDQFALDYIGKIPKAFNEEGEVTEWSTQNRFNVRLIDESVTLFDEFENVYPETPYRVFS